MVSIDTHHAWVEFPIFDVKARSLKKAFLGRAGGAIGRTASNVVVIEALRDITLSMSIGDRVGLVGHNGAGKSTLLRLLSGIYEPTRGSAVVHGRVAPIFDLGIGMDPEISGYENIIIRGLFLGESRKSMLSKVDEIAEFTELGDFLSMPLRTYSTGMRVRLAMGVVTIIPRNSAARRGHRRRRHRLFEEGAQPAAGNGRTLRHPGVRGPFQRIPRAAVHNGDMDRPWRAQNDLWHRRGHPRLRRRGRRPPRRGHPCTVGGP
jgi:ABC transporter